MWKLFLLFPVRTLSARCFFSCQSEPAAGTAPVHRTPVLPGQSARGAQQADPAVPRGGGLQEAGGTGQCGLFGVWWPFLPSSEELCSKTIETL